ncbi:MAG: hypothetical protein PVH88_14920 [Ignavibacteria bacterium]|jgi:hypothetical protein
MKEKFLFMIIIIQVSLFTNLSAQINSPAIGASIGGGKISRQSSDIISFSTGLFIQAAPWFMDDYALRLGFHYSRELEYFLPGNKRNYFPFIKAFSLKLVLTQYSGGGKFFEEAVGIVYLNDRIFSDVNNWSTGTIFNAQFGFDLRNELKKGFTIGPNLEYVFTFNNISTSMFSINIQSLYYF